MTRDQSKYWNLVDVQMSLMCQEGDDISTSAPATKQANTQFNLQTAINQRRIIVVKFPYSDMRNVPSQLPLKVRMYSTISVPLETKQLIRRIQRVEQLTVSINLQVVF